MEVSELKLKLDSNFIKKSYEIIEEYKNFTGDTPDQYKERVILTILSALKTNENSNQNYQLIRNDIIQQDYEVSHLSPEAVSSFLTFLEVFMEAEITFEDNEDLVEAILKILDCVKEKYSNNRLFTDTLSKLWKKSTSIGIKEQLLNLHPNYFQELIVRVVEDFILMYSESTPNKELLNYDFSYIELIQYISESGKLFQYFSMEIAKRMIQEDFSNESVWKLLEIILEDMRQKLSKEEFYNLYSDSQKIYSILIDNFKDHENCSNLLDSKLKSLKEESLTDFVIVTTHSGSDKYLMMLK